MHLHLIHGFLGLPTDWEPVVAALPQLQRDKRTIHLVNLWKNFSPQTYQTLSAAGQALASSFVSDENIVVGYSLGGRIAMHLPREAWSRVRVLILISCHPGGLSLEEKTLRNDQDHQWAQKFENKPWPQLMEEWNGQDVLRSDAQRVLRFEKDFDHQILSSALRHWSLASQEDLVEQLKDVPFPVKYLYGRNDEKFSNVATRLQTQLPKWTYCPLEGGHGLHLTHPSDVAREIQKSLEPIS